MDLLSFCLLAIAIIIIPGPNVLVIISTSLSHGTIRGLQTVAGTSCAMVIQLLIAAIGTAWLVTTLSYGFILLKWAGVFYLLFLGLQQGLAFFRNTPIRPISARFSFKRGFWVSLTNPKTIIFFSAFLPQFVIPNEAYLPQIALLSILFLGLAILIDFLYVIVTGFIHDKLHSEAAHRYQQGFASIIYFFASGLLAATKQSP